MTALDPDDFAHADEAEHADRTGPEEDTRTCDRCGDEVQTLSSRDLCDGCEEEQEREDTEARAGDGQGPGCPHPPGSRIRDPEDGTQVCTDCSEVIAQPTTEEQAAGRSAWIEPAEPDSGQGVLRHIPWGPGQRPYTPEDVEHEILEYIARLNSGAKFQAGKEVELREARVKYEIEAARALLQASGRSAQERKAQALLDTRELWTQVQILEQVVQTTRQGMHTLRQQLTGLQSVSRSVGVTGGTGPAPRGAQFQ